jgi:hypothetical protein
MPTTNYGVSRKGFPRALKGLYDFLSGTKSNGAVPAVTGLTITENGVGPIKQTVFNFSNVAFALADNAGVVAYSGKKIYDFPEGLIKVLGAVANLALTKSSAGVNTNWDGDFGVGTVTASNDGTLASTEQNIIPTTATPQATAGATTARGKNAADIAPLDGTGTAIDLYLNFLVDDADHDVTTTPCNLIVNGTLTVTWMNLGDHG